MTELNARPEIEDGMEAVNAEPVIRAIVRLLASRRSVTADGPVAGYAGVRPAVRGTISVYVHGSYVDLALDPVRAKSLSEVKGWKLVKSNPTTAFLRITAEHAQAPGVQDLAVELCCEAVDKSEAGPAYEGGSPAAGGAAVDVEVCPIHFEQMLGGTCSECA